jgi:hypothetical protein
MANILTACTYLEHLQQVGCCSASVTSSKLAVVTLVTMKCSTGVMLSLSIVHVIADSFEDLDGLAGNYPIAAVFVITGVYLMSIAEIVSIHCFKHKVCQKLFLPSMLYLNLLCGSHACSHALMRKAKELPSKGAILMTLVGIQS